MLSPADAAVCARDPALPGLSGVLDAERLAEGLGLAGLRQSYLRYKPGTSAVAGLTATDGSLRAFAAMTYRHDRYAEVRARPEWQIRGDPVLFLDDACTAIVPISRDRNIRAARRICDAGRLDGYVARFGLRHPALTLLRYKPGRRLVVRADDEAGPVAVIKSHAGDAFRAAIAGARHASASFGLPLPLVDESRECIVTPWVGGRTLSPGTSGPDALRATGAELARLHSASTSRTGVRAGWDADELRAEAEALAILTPGLGRDARRLSAALARQVPAAPQDAVTIHGDFSADQVVMSATGPVVIDWDRAAPGDPRRDLGSFLARLDAQVIGGTLTRRAAEAAEEALLEGYAERAGGAPEGLAAWRAAALFALATEAFRTRQPDWPARAEATLERAEALLRGSRRGAEATAGLSDALDITLLRPKLAAALGRSEDAMPGLTAQLVRHKPGRRALIRYTTGDSSGAVLGKLRAKGADRRTPGLHAALRSAGFDGRHPHGVGVPEVRGMLDDPPLWLQSEVLGRSLTACLLSADAVGCARRAGRALALLHEADVPTGRDWTLADELGVLDRALECAASELPESRERIEAVASAAQAAVASLDAPSPTGIHRDFHPDQVLVDGETLWLLDLDLFARGDPVIDVANFLAHLAELGLRLQDDPFALAREGRAFVTGYEEKRGCTDRRRLRTLYWIALARHIRISRLHPDRTHTTGPLIRLCAEGLQACAPIVTRSGRGDALGGDPSRPPQLRLYP